MLILYPPMHSHAFSVPQVARCVSSPSPPLSVLLPCLPLSFTGSFKLAGPSKARPFQDGPAGAAAVSGVLLAPAPVCVGLAFETLL
jgi:hypothetical protein